MPLWLRVQPLKNFALQSSIQNISSPSWTRSSLPSHKPITFHELFSTRMGVYHKKVWMSRHGIVWTHLCLGTRKRFPQSTRIDGWRCSFV